MVKREGWVQLFQEIHRLAGMALASLQSHVCVFVGVCVGACICARVCVCAENPSETASRTLKLIAKVLQMLANLVDAGPKVTASHYVNYLSRCLQLTL